MLKIRDFRDPVSLDTPPRRNQRRSVQLRRQEHRGSFVGWEGPILEHYLPGGTTVNNEDCRGQLENHLKPAARSKRRGLHSAGMFIQHDNTRPHTS